MGCETAALRSVRTARRAFPFDANRVDSPRSVGGFVFTVKIFAAVDLSPLTDKLRDLWTGLDQLFGEHHFVTILCGFLALMMTISFYRLLKSVSPALVAFICLLMLFILTMHWTVTRTEPAFMTPAIDFIAPFFPSAPEYPQQKKTKPAPAKPKPAAPKPKPAPAKY